MSSPFERATRPDQYDADDLFWEKEARSESGRTQFFWEYLEPYADSWKDKKVLDVGAGTGWLVSQAQKHGAAKALGIEPSSKNIAAALRDHSDAMIQQDTLESFDSGGERFDQIVAN